MHTKAHSLQSIKTLHCITMATIVINHTTIMMTLSANNDNSNNNTVITQCMKSKETEALGGARVCKAKAS